MPRYELETLELRGSPAEMGRQQGQHFGRKLHDFVEMRLAAARDYLGDRKGPQVDALFECGRLCYEALRAWDPAQVAEHEAMCAAAGVDAISVHTAANMTDIRDVLLLSGSGPSHGPLAPDAEGCTAILVPGARARDGAVIAGQTWDLNPGDVDYVIALHRLPTDGPESWTVTVTGAPTLMGMNAAGLALGTTNIKTWRSRPGVGYVHLLQRALRCRTRAEAQAAITAAPRAGAHTYWLADAAGTIELEATPFAVEVRQGHGEALCRTNHCLTASHALLEGEAPTPSSLARLSRASHVTATTHLDVERLQALFADRSDGVHSINRYPEDQQGTATDAVMIAVPERLELHGCRGPADRGVWRRLPFVTVGR